MDIFNNREIAIGIWTFGVLVLCIANPKIREDLYNLIKCFTQKPIIISLSLMILYLGLIVYGLYKIELWSITQLKNTIIWSVAVGFVSLIGISNIAENPKKYFKMTFKDTFRLVTILEFIIGFYVFSLWAELLIVPASTFLVIMQAVAEREENNFLLHNFLNSLLMWLGIGLVLHAVFNLVMSFDSFATLDTLSDFSIPPILTLLYMPFLLAMAIYANYENVFMRLQFAIKDTELRTYAKRRALFSFHCSSVLSKRWVRNMVIKTPKSKEEINNSIAILKELYRKEKNPPYVPFEKGWSPYVACDFLSSHKLTLSDYHYVYDDTWIASPVHLKLGNTILENTVQYYIKGNETTCTLLELSLAIEEHKKAKEDKQKFISIAKHLFNKALSHEMPQELESNIIEENENSLSVHDKEAIISIKHWPNSYNNRYEIKFSIQSTNYKPYFSSV